MDLHSFSLPFERPSPYHPPPAFADLREQCPLVRTVDGVGRPVWLVLGADLAQRLLTDARFAIVEPGGNADTDSLLCDGAAHDRLRGLISRGFGARAIDRLRPRIRELADAHVADLAAAGPPADLVALLALPLARAVIADLLSVDVADRDRFAAWAQAISTVVAEPDGTAVDGWTDLLAFLGGLVAARRAAPGPDLLSALAAEGLTERQLVLAGAALLAGGQLTSANALSIGVVKLLTTGGLRGLADESAACTVVEEILRHQAGVSGEPYPRWALSDVDIAGHRITAGDMVIVRLEAANRDTARFADPDRFDRTRTPNRHLRFGYGPHHCVGAAIARTQLVAVITALATRLPGLALACAPEDVRWTGAPLDDGPVALPVTW
ncbi:putative cytochrome P450 hydroxylase [Alloactinosynnema sp. L-07]|uniref:cytochrome P450 n=1 Tax=Alloactinosynnema sp. L-07 TaxID=1653480 RepID=UPI00065EFFBB|nr:cytochrome P450 [Alloactinosynnema sp. L-07]CRK61977.1 putative cytochrome P450 hydroxylase [Alloactinosynnema sp. L-07]